MQGPPLSSCSCYAARNASTDHAPTCPCYQPSEIPIPKRRGDGDGGNKIPSLALDSSSCNYSEFEANANTQPPQPLPTTKTTTAPSSTCSYQGYGHLDSVSSESMFPPRPPSIATSLTSVSSFLDSVIEEGNGSVAGDVYHANSFSSLGHIGRHNHSTHHHHHHTLSTISASSSVATHLQTMPTEIFHCIFSYLSPADLKEAALVNREWHSMAVSVIWRRLVVPMDKRTLSSMKSALVVHGHRVQELIIAPPDSISGIGLSISRRTSVTPSAGGSGYASVSRSHSLSQGPRSRSSSVSSTPKISALGHINLPLQQQQQQQPQSTNNNNFASEASTSSVGSTSGRRHFRGTPSPSPSMSPSRATPIPGTPGVGNMPIDIPTSMPLPSISASVGSTPSNAPGGALSSSYTNSNSNTNNNNNNPLLSRSNITGTPPQQSNNHHHHYSISTSSSQQPYRQVEISESTVTRLHRYMETYCPNVTRITARNPLGIASPERRYHLLARFFDIYPNTEQLNLSEFIMWEPSPMRAIPEKLHSLEELDVSGRVELNDSDILPIVQGCPRLATLKLRATNISDAAIDCITDNLANTLRYLNISGCRVTSAAMARLVTYCHALQALRGWSCLPLGDDFLQALKAENLPCLQALDLKGVYGFTASTVQRTFEWQSWPQLRYLCIHYKGDPQVLAECLPNTYLKIGANTDTATSNSTNNSRPSSIATNVTPFQSAT